jgi:DNA-binding SARP family transcriptional activator
VTQLQTLTDHNSANIATQIENRRLVILAPRLRNRNAFMSWFLQAGADTYLYTLTAQDVTLPAFLANLVTGLQDIDPKFGRQTSQALASPRAEPADLADALLADLGKAKPKPRFLVLDEFDALSQGVDTDAFFERLANTLPPGLQLVINSRQLAYQPWYSMVQSGDAVVLGASQVLDGSIFNPDIPEGPHLEIYGFGGGSVFMNGVSVESWDGPLPRNLFYYFVDHPLVTRDDIFQTFWPELPTKEATNVFHVTKRKISERLGYEVTGYSGGFYRPSGQMHLHYDVAQFEEAVREGREEQEPASPDIWYRAIRLYRSEFLHKIEMPWIARRREELRLTYAESLIGVGRLHKALDDTERAISYYLRALREVPEREDIHRDVMTLYEGRGERDKAIAQYQMLADTLKRNLNITPSKATRNLYSLLVNESSS